MRAMRLPGLLLAGWLPLVATAESPGPRELETLVGRWVDLRAQADSEQRGWASQSAQWRQEMGLLETEQARLNQQLAALEQTGESQQELRANLMERRESLASALLQVDAHLTRLQPGLAALLPLVPEPLLTEDLKTALLPAVAAVPPAGGAPGAARRIQQLLGALQEVERLHNAVHTVKALIALPGEPRRQMDVVYIGLARGFAVTADGGTAAAGTPAVDGWHWRPVPALASDIRLLIRIASREVPPALVSFPIGGETGVQPGAGQGEVQ
jgi:hypothetical protein